ncbi:MAG: ABC transporter ATP-binding protein [Halieaceae bacterium]|nr:ABC transporter ATP-binding protein [Halieaceae bacterium]
MSEIILKSIKKSYTETPAVWGLDLHIEEGQFLTILGPSGCGKTTTLRLIAGLEDPDEGEIIIGDRILFSREKGIYVPPEKRQLGLIFQSYALWPHMTVAKNISLGLEEKRLPKDEIERRVSQVLQQVQLSEYRDRYPSELSGGQQQRVAVARMIAAEPIIILMDEPLSNLDAMLRVDMRAELKHLHHDLSATTVYVTHDQVEAMTLSDKIAVMMEGELRQLGTPREIYSKPADLFVARFVGSPRINIIEGRIVSETDADYFHAETLRKPVGSGLDFGVGQVIATIRPEDIHVSKTERRGWLEVLVYSVLPTGAETIVTIQKETLSLAIKLGGFTDIEMNDAIWVDFDAAKMNYYDPKTEKLLRSV